MHTHLRLAVTTFVLALSLGPAARAQHPAMPAGMTHAEHLKQLEKDADLKGLVRYEYASAPNGGRVVMTTANAKALTAIYDFLRYQIREHGTGDPLTVEGERRERSEVARARTSGLRVIARATRSVVIS